MDKRVFPLLNCYHYIVVSKWFINDKVCRAGGILPLSYSKFVLSSWSDHFTPVQFGYSSFFLIWFYVGIFLIH